MRIDHKFDWPNDNDYWRDKIYRERERKISRIISSLSSVKNKKKRRHCDASLV